MKTAPLQVKLSIKREKIDPVPARELTNKGKRKKVDEPNKKKMKIEVNSFRGDK